MIGYAVFLWAHRLRRPFGGGAKAAPRRVREAAHTLLPEALEKRPDRRGPDAVSSATLKRSAASNANSTRRSRPGKGRPGGHLRDSVANIANGIVTRRLAAFLRRYPGTTLSPDVTKHSSLPNKPVADDIDPTVDAMRPGRAGRAAAMALLLSTGCWAGAVAHDGDWELSISGHNSYLFGEPGFGGGLRIPWEVLIRFRVQDGEYLTGSGSARWLDSIETLSHPAGWFSCRQVEGTYLDSSLTLHETPRVRFAGFPVAGEVRDGRVRLQPGYEPPGNYLAVTYECVNERPFADNWFALAERGKQILGKRQDAEKKRDVTRQYVRVREVDALPPEGGLELPLHDGWAFVRGGRDDDLFVHYRLRRP